MIDPPDELTPAPDADPADQPAADPGFDSAFDAADPEARPPASPARRALGALVALALVAAIVLFAALGGVGLVRFAGGDPTPAPRPARLAIVDASGNLSTVDTDRGAPVPASGPGIHFRFPAWSPDGMHLAAIGEDGSGSGVYVVDATTGATPTDPVVVYRSADHTPFYLYWSLDGQRLTFLTNEPDGIALRIATADGSGTVTVLRQGAPLYWDWVDNGRLLAHIGGSVRGAFVGELGLDGAAVGTALIEGQSTLPGPFRAPAASRDGRYRAFAEIGADATGRIVVEARDGSTSYSVPESGPTAFSFDPGGGSVAFVAADPGARVTTIPVGSLRVLDATTGSSRLLLGGSVIAFFWAPDGKTIATLGVAGPGGDEVQAGVSRTVASLARLAPPRTRLVTASSPDGIETATGFDLSLAFVDVASAAVRSHRAVRVTDTFANQILPYFDQYTLSHRFWSADSVSFALPLVVADGTDQVEVIPADGSPSHSVPGGVMGFWSP